MRHHLILILLLVLMGACTSQAPATSDLFRTESKSMSALDMLSVGAAIAPCWNVPEGSHLAVRLRVTVDESGHFTSAEVLDRERYQADPVFRSAADAAQRAVMNPRCYKIPLLPERLASLRPSFVLNFEPIKPRP
jgi:hypothetical protein